jgi:tetratricopeptide (TPR) repeat protein
VNDHDCDDDDDDDDEFVPHTVPHLHSTSRNNSSTSSTSNQEQMVLLQQRGLYYLRHRLYDAALPTYQILLELLRATGQSGQQIGLVHYYSGLIQYHRGYYYESLSHLDQALFIYQVNQQQQQHHQCSGDPTPTTTNRDGGGGGGGSTNGDTLTALTFVMELYQVYFVTGLVHLATKNPYRAIQSLERAMQLVQQIPPSYHPIVEDDDDDDHHATMMMWNSHMTDALEPPTSATTTTATTQVSSTRSTNSTTFTYYNHYSTQTQQAINVARAAIGK